MNQLRKAKSRNRRRHTVLPRKYIKVVVTYVLLFAIVFSNMSNPLLNVFAGQKKEEFRIHADELQRAAEEALEKGNIVEEPLDFYTKDSSLLKEYEKLFAADGTLYEIFPNYEREYYLDDIELRIFLRISPDADPDSYALTGEETLIFLYTNGGEETVAGRVNIDGYISGICSLKSYMTAFEKKENSGSHNSGNSSSSGTKTEPGIDPSEAETAEEVPGTDQEPTDDGEKNSQVDFETETEEVKEPEASDAGKNDDEDKSHEDGPDAENSNTENNGSANEENPDTEDKSDTSENTPDENPEENTSDNENSEDTGSDNEDQGEEVSDNGDSSEDAGDTADDTDNSSSSDTVASISIHSRIFLTDTMQEETEEETEAPTEEETEKETETETEAETETETEPEKETSAEATEPETDPVPEETTPGETTADETLPQETPEETTAAENKDNTGATETGAAAQPETEETTAADDTKLSDLPGAVEETETEPGFERVGVLKGETYNLVALDQTITARAFTAKLSDMGFDKDELESQGHIINYMIDPVGSAELVKAPKLTRDGAEVTFGVIPQTGYKITEVTANGVELEETDPENIASPSNAERADEAVYYTIPEVLEDQEVEIFLEEIVPGTHPAFNQAKTVNGVTVTVTAEEGIIPEGTELTVTEVTDQVQEAVIEKTANEEEADTKVTAVIAYDINLMLDGKKLNNDWGQSHHVNVKFSGERIEQLSKEADTLQVATLETPTETVEAALGGTEEMPVVDNITPDNIQINAEDRKSIDVAGEASVDAVEFEAKHFTIYTITFGNNNSSSYGVRIIQLDENGDVISMDTGTISVTGTNVGIESVLSFFTPNGYEYSWAMLGGKYNNESNISHETLNEMTLLSTLSREGRRNNYYLTYTGQDRNLGAVSGSINGKNHDIYIVYRNKSNPNKGIKLYYLPPANDGYELPYMNGVKFVVDCINTAGQKVDLPAGSYIPDVLTFDDVMKITSSTFSDISIPGYTFTDKGYCFFWWGGNEDNFFSTSARATVTGLKNWGRVSDNYPSYNYIGYNSNEFVWTDWKNESGNYVAYNPTGSLHVVFVEVSTTNPPKTYYASMNKDIGVPLTDKTVWRDPHYEFYPIDKTDEYTETYLRTNGFAPDEEPGYEWNFKGWTTTFDTVTGNGTGDIIPDGFFDNPVNQDVHLYAKWEKTQVKTDIEITKTLEGISGTSDELKKVEFQIYNSDASWNKGTLVQTVNATETGSVKFTQLPVGNYLIYETKTADGYILLTEPIKVTVSQKEDKTLEWTVDGAAEKKHCEVVNRKGVILPDTGGSGLNQIRRIGWSVVITSVLYAGIQLSLTLKRKREE